MIKNKNDKEQSNPVPSKSVHKGAHISEIRLRSSQGCQDDRPGAEVTSHQNWGWSSLRIPIVSLMVSLHG